MNENNKLSIKNSKSKKKNSKSKRKIVFSNNPSISKKNSPSKSSSKKSKSVKVKFSIPQAEKRESKKLLSRINEIINENTSHSKNRIEPVEWVLPNKKEFPLWVTQTFMKYRQDSKGDVPSKGKPKPLKHQRFLRDYMGKNSPYRGVLLFHGLGSGKCHAKGTPIMMYDGTIKKVEDIIEGDELMGDNSRPRKVLSLARGTDEMYDIIPVKGDSYRVNQEHILCLKASGYPKFSENNNPKIMNFSVNWIEDNQFKCKSFSFYNGDKKEKEQKRIQALNYLEKLKNIPHINESILEISVKDYLKLPKSKKDILKGYRVKVDFPEKDLSIDPYMIGYWLGDGSSNSSEISCQDSTVLHYFSNNLGKYNLYLTYKSQYDYYISGNGKKGNNIFLNTLKENNLLGNKHIPYIYKCNSRENRLKLLAGLIDSDGHYDSNGGFEFTNKNETLMDDVIYLARSLGFSCYKSFKKTSWTYKDIKKEGSAFRICINGEGIEEIPTLIPRKKALPRNQIKDVLVTGIDVKYVNEDEYYGFTLDGNSRYLMGDFTVTHNTFSSIFISENLKTERNVVFLSPASLKPNFIQDGLLSLGNPEYNANPKSIYDKYSFVSFNASNTPDQIRAIGGFDNKVIIIEETHNLVSRMVSGLLGISKHGKEIYDYLMNAKNAKIVALTGSPAINDPFELAVLFNILRGYIEVTNFRVMSVSPQYGAQWNFETIMPQLLETPFIDYLEFKKANSSLEVHFTKKHYEPEYKDSCDALIQKCSMLNIDIKYLDKTNVSLFPVDDNGEMFYEYFVDENKDGVHLKNSDIFKRRILGLVSYYTAKEDIPTKNIRDYYRVKMSDYQYKIYEVLREKERKTEKGSNSANGTRRKKKRLGGTKSTFRVFSRQASNFVFPENIPRPYPDPSFVVSVDDFGKKKRENVQNIAKMIQKENLANEEGEIENDYKLRIDEALQKLVQNGETYFRAGANGLDKLSPKMKIMLENIQSSPGLVFVYSNFRSVEGVELFTKVLDFNGFSRFESNNNLPKYAVYSGTEDQEVKTKIIQTFKADDNKYGEKIKILLATSAGAEGLDLKNIRQIHIMEPYWNQVRIKQVIGRGVRYRSHIALPPEERNVEVFRYFSVLSKDQMLMTREKISTDEHIEDISMKKQNIIDELELCLKEAAIDCMLNASYLKGEYNCYSFGTGATGFSYMPSLRKDVISTNTTKEVKKVKKEYIIIYFSGGKAHLLDENNKFYLYRDASKTPVTLDIKKIKRYSVNPLDDKVYDYESTLTGTPLLIGIIDEKSQIRKVK